MTALGVPEMFRAEQNGATTTIGAAHPADRFDQATAELLAATSEANVVCVNPCAATFEDMAEEIDLARRALELPHWLFWGMSGGGYLAMLHARRHPEALRGIVIESACVCFRERLADPTCALSPYFPSWRPGLEQQGLLDPGAHLCAEPVIDTEWIEVEGVGEVFRKRSGPALLVSPIPIDEAIKRAMPELWRFDARAWLHELSVPALVLAGSADPIVPVHRVRELHEGLPRSTLVVIEGAGHVPSSARNPTAEGAIRDFVRRAQADWG